MAKNQSTLRAFEILNVIAAHQTGVTLTEICQEVDIPKSTVFDILNALLDCDAVFLRNPETKTYVIGAKVYRLGQSYTKNENFISISSRNLKKFAENYHATVYACTRRGDKATWLWKYEPQDSRVETRQAGVPFSLETDPTGEAIMAFSQFQSELLSHVLYKDYAGNPLANGYQAMVKRIQEISTNKYMVNNGDFDEYQCIFAVPIFNYDNHCLGLVGAVVPTHDAIEEDIEIQSELDELIRIAWTTSAKLGYNGHYNEKKFK